MDKSTNLHVTSVFESLEPKAEIGDHFSVESSNQHWIRIFMYFSKLMLGPIQLQWNPVPRHPPIRQCSPIRHLRKTLWSISVVLSILALSLYGIFTLRPKITWNALEWSVTVCQLSGWKRFLFSAGHHRNKNVLKLEAGMFEKIRTF